MVGLGLGDHDRGVFATVAVVQNTPNQARCHLNGGAREEAFVLLDRHVSGSEVFEHFSATPF